MSIERSNSKYLTQNLPPSETEGVHPVHFRSEMDARPASFRMQLHVTSTIHRLSPGIDELSLRDFIETQVRYHQPESDAKKIYNFNLKIK